MPVRGKWRGSAKDGNQAEEDIILSDTAHNMNKEANNRDLQGAKSIGSDGKSTDSDLVKDESIRSSGGNGGNGGNGGRAVAMCILIAPVINIDSNIPFEPNAVLERPNLSYAPY